MTLGLSIARRPYVLNASDRLVSTVRGKTVSGAFDRYANKTIVYLAGDGPIAISYAGIAFVGRKPADEWLAEVLLGSPFRRWPDGSVPAFGFQRSPMRSINSALWLLQKAIERQPCLARGPFELTIAGWRFFRRGRIAPVCLTIEAVGGKALRKGDLRFAPRYGTRGAFVGQHFDPVKIEQACDAHPQRERLSFDAEIGAEVLVATIRDVAKGCTSVGSDVMVVQIPAPIRRRVVVIRYFADPSRPPALFGAGPAQVPAAFFPWVITPTFIRAPTIAAGDAGTLSSCGWEFEFRAVGLPAAAYADGLLFAETHLNRPSPPGWPKPTLPNGQTR